MQSTVPNMMAHNDHEMELRQMTIQEGVVEAGYILSRKDDSALWLISVSVSAV